jgi:outer membrane protein
MRKSAFFSLLVVFVFSVLTVRLSFAENIEDAWKTALAVNNRLLASKKNVESLNQSLEAAKSARYPSLNIDSGYTVLNEAPAAVVSIPNVPANKMPTSEDKSLSYKTIATLPLYTGGRISSGIEAASASLRGAIQDDIKSILDLRMDVVDAYVGILRARHGVDVSESNVQSLSSHVKDVTNFFEQGIITKNDLLSAKVSLSDAQQRLIQAENTLNVAQAAYNRLLGRPLDYTVTIDDLSAEPAPVNMQALTEAALDKRPELRSLSEQSQALRRQAAGVRASALPQIAVSGGYSYQQNKYQVYQDLWSATLGLTWELFDAGISRHNANAILQRAEAINRIHDDTASVIALQVRQASLEVSETLRRIDVTKEAMAQADENLRVTKDRYREGVGTNTEVLDAETLRVRSYTNYYNAVYDAVTAKFRLRYVVGEL